MGVLTRKEILARMSDGRLGFEPGLDGFQVQPHAVDLRLGTSFYLAKTWDMTERGREALKVDYLDLPGGRDNGHEYFHRLELKPGQFFEILPKEFVIVSTLEMIKIMSDDIMGVLYPRSSVNRRGLSVDLSGIIDVGYQGHLVIPIANRTQTQVIRLYPGERICQVVFQALDQAIPAHESGRHGLSDAKYAQADAAGLGSKADKEDERRLVRTGDLDALKRDYPAS